MHLELNYGRGTLPVDLPPDLQVTVVDPPMPVLPDPAAAVRAALAAPGRDAAAVLVGAGPRQRLHPDL